MNNRLLLIRKKLNLTQEIFGSHLGVRKTAISKLEKGENNLTEQMIISICREFNVNEEWLRNGTGEMFIETDSTLLAELANEYKLNTLDLGIVKYFLMLNPKDRDEMKKHILGLAQSITKDNIEKEKSISYKINKPASLLVAESEVPYENSIDAEVEAYRKELEAEAKGKTSSVSEGTKKRGNLG
jgi:transcriptional regulator with XRE-family HTH domain